MSQSILLKIGDCRILIEGLDDKSVEAFISDPPYDLTGNNKSKKTVAKKGFMGNAWDATGITFDPKFWELLYRKASPGAVAKFFGATRTYHKMCRAMKQGGFVDIRFDKNWIYGSGFPKSTNISKQIDRVLGAKRKVIGTKKGIGGENLNDIVRGSKHVRDTSRTGAKGIGAYGTGAKQVSVEVVITAPESPDAIKYNGVGTALKPAWEPIIKARKPLEDSPSKKKSNEVQLEPSSFSFNYLMKDGEGGFTVVEENPSDLEEVCGTLISLEVQFQELADGIQFERLEPQEPVFELILEGDELEMKLREYVQRLAKDLEMDGNDFGEILESMFRECEEGRAAHIFNINNRDCEGSFFNTEKIERLEEELGEVKENLEKLESVEVDNGDLEKEKEEQQKKYKELQAEKEKLEVQVGDLKVRVEKLELEADDLILRRAE